MNKNNFEKMGYIASSIFLLAIPLLKKISSELKRLERRATNAVKKHKYKEKVSTQLKERACHFNELFITYTGEIFPCCLRRLDSKTRIAHINDDNLLNIIRGFYVDCHCQRFKLRKGLPGENITVQLINIELSLVCQGKCALCCVESPAWKGIYDYYDSLTKVIDLLRPNEILVQGGEVLVQKKSLDWLEQIKDIYPTLNISLVTNGNANLNMLNRVEKIFNELKISFMAFESETYERIMGMSFEKTITFVEELARRKKVKLILKYLITPLSIHETNLFLEWAIDLNPFYTFIEDADTLRYINTHTKDKFWKKISERTGEKVKTILFNNKNKLLKSTMTVQFSTECIEILGLKSCWENFIEESNLQEKVLIYWM